MDSATGADLSQYSLNEVEALARKAARGAGMSWGLAEDTGRAIRWLEARGFAGAAALADYLTWRDEGGEVAPLEERSGLWRGVDGPLCPIAVGAYLSDSAAADLPVKMTLVSLRKPLLIVPFAAWAAKELERDIKLESGDEDVWLGHGGEAYCAGFSKIDEADVSLRQEEVPGDAMRRDVTTRSTAERGPLEVLDRIASRTYAPATEASRLAGAGAGTSDND